MLISTNDIKRVIKQGRDIEEFIKNAEEEELATIRSTEKEMLYEALSVAIGNSLDHASNLGPSEIVEYITSICVEQLTRRGRIKTTE